MNLINRPVSDVDKNHRIPEKGYGMGYQESVRIECLTNLGMTPDEFYRRQAGLVLDKIPDSLTGESGDIERREISPDFKVRDGNGKTLKEKALEAGIPIINRCNLNLGPGKRVLDLAVGEGDTSRYLAATGATVEATDYEQDLVDAGVRRDTELRHSQAPEGVVSAIRSKIHQNLGQMTYSRADYGNVKEFLPSPENNQYDAITVLSRSFIYLGERANYEKSLKDFYDLLKPGGKVVIQARDNMPGKLRPWAEATKTREFDNDDGDAVYEDETNGMSFAWRWGKRQVRKLSNGVNQVTASRYLKHKDGQIQELGEVTYDEHLRLNYLEMWAEMLKKVGFINVGVKAERLTSNERVVMYAIVAEKPQA